MAAQDWLQPNNSLQLTALSRGLCLGGWAESEAGQREVSGKAVAQLSSPRYATAEHDLYTELRITLQFRHHTPNDSQAIVQLFSSVFAKSEGEDEGKLVSQLANDLLAHTDGQDIFCFVAVEGGRIVGSIFFSRSDFAKGVSAFILAPVAVHSDHQSKGIGQALINYSLSELRDRGVSMVITYGDSNFYRQVGFRHISPETIRAPLDLSQPEGWLGQSLSGEALEALSGDCTCVEALNDPAYW